MFFLKDFVSVTQEQAADLQNNTINNSNEMDRWRCSIDDEHKNEALSSKKTMLAL